MKVNEVAKKVGAKRADLYLVQKELEDIKIAIIDLMIQLNYIEVLLENED